MIATLLEDHTDAERQARLDADDPLRDRRRMAGKLTAMQAAIRSTRRAAPKLISGPAGGH